ncbi:hypothetical protein SAY86_026441 [Trapa natans]|uniref:Cyclin-like domain-containing protein n=1 Tax=Trapa natans TaxID=22666 RepID=A0AAN7KJT0_TRANT|nr:hypothetical protein SAY86_026441 [Trapa natans]
MEDSDSSLLCQETLSSFKRVEGGDGDEEENIQSCCPPMYIFEGECEYVEEMIGREAVEELEGSDSCLSQFGSSMADGPWWRQARLDSIEWILSARSFLGFHYRTACLAVTYIDQFLAKRTLGDGKLWAVQLLSVACLSLAAKMEECHVPVLSGFPSQKYQFESRVITKMELLILYTLDWKMASITPFTYLDFFIHKLLGKADGRDIFKESIEVVFAALKEINLLDYRPSMIAAAAVLASSSSAQLTSKTVELKIGALSSWRSEHYERVYSCYVLMLGLKEKGGEKTPGGRMLPPSMGTLRYSSSLTSSGNLKRRLEFIDHSEKMSPIKKAKKQ